MKLITLLNVVALSMSVAFTTSLNAQTNVGTKPIILAQDNKNTPSDTGITTDIKSKFIKEKLFGDADVSAMSIHVETNNGVVHLTGTANNQVQIDNAVTLSQTVEGVKKVINDIKLKN